jgi:putative addiction module killer protein
MAIHPYGLAIVYPNGYNMIVYTVLRSDEFDQWLTGLKDAKGKARIVARIKSAELGNLGDVKPVGEGVSEMRIHYGPGYRVYFTQRGRLLILLLVGGDKSSQKRDIVKAKALASRLKE